MTGRAHPQEVLDFWFSDAAKKHWFNSTPDFDETIRARFEPTAESLAEAGEPRGAWARDASAMLAFVISLDQFPRNMYRGEAKAFTWDPISLRAAKQMVERGMDMEVAQDRRSFVYMPYMHSENLMDQNRCVELAGSRLDDGGSTLRHAAAHRDVIQKFGRFPHRNDTLGRESTAEEIQFLADGGYDPS